MQIDKQAKCDICGRILLDDIVVELADGTKICAECQLKESQT